MSELSVKLRTTIKNIEEARINGLAAQAAAETAKIEREKRELQSYLDLTKSNIVDQIEMGKVPLVVIKDYTKQRMWRDAQAQKAPHQHMWNSFFGFFASEDLAVKLVDDHDGVGMESWINLTVVPK